MFAKQESRTHKAERIAGQAWDNLSAAVDSAGASTKSARRRAAGVVDDTSQRVESGAKEAHRRANAAFDALAGRRPPTRWGGLAAAALVGAALGWVATTMGRQFMPHRDTPRDIPRDILDRPDSLDEGIRGADLRGDPAPTRY